VACFIYFFVLTFFAFFFCFSKAFNAFLSLSSFFCRFSSSYRALLNVGSGSFCAAFVRGGGSADCCMLACCVTCRRSVLSMALAFECLDPPRAAILRSTSSIVWTCHSKACSAVAAGSSCVARPRLREAFWCFLLLLGADADATGSLFFFACWPTVVSSVARSSLRTSCWLDMITVWSL